MKRIKRPIVVFFYCQDECLSGKIILYKEKPGIVLYDEKQIVLK